MQTTKTKRVFQLRKTGSVRANNNQQSRVVGQQEQKGHVPEIERAMSREKTIPNDSLRHQNQNQSTFKQQEQTLSAYPEVTVDQQNVQVKNIKVKNVGSSAIYYQWNFKNLPKINANAIKDPKPNFYCHYQPNVIKPGQQVIFSFSFFSQTPGVFVEEVSLLCQPQPTTPILPIKLKGIAFIEDKLKNKRQQLNSQIKQKVTQVFTKQVLQDIVYQVKSPVPPLPDVSNPTIAQQLFQEMNSNERLYYNPQVHKWFSKLYQDICDTLQIPPQSRHWDQSVAKLNTMIQSVKDPILKQSYDKRVQNYKSLSSTRPPQKSDLFPKVKEILLNVGYLLGGSIVDESRKQLDMWQIPFQQPSQAQTQQQQAAKKDQRTKISAQWAKKQKKKKWGADQESQMLNNYKAKLQKGVSKTLVQKLDGFDDQASFQSCKARIKQNFNSQKYFGFLERLKTVEQFPIQGKKILLKYDLKLKDNSQEALLKLQQYLQKKKQQQLRLQQQKKNQEANKAKKKAAPVKKKKGQKQQEQQKAITFDFNTLLDQESWQGFTTTLKFIIQKQPQLLVIGISYGPKTGIFNEKSSIKFLLQPLKVIQPSIEFLQHKDLFELKTKIQDQTLNEGSIYLTQNLSFLPCQGMETGEIKIIQKVQNGQQKKIESVSSYKMLMPQVERQLQKLMPIIDIIVREDRFVNRVSGICSYGKKDNILGSTWWKFIAFALRTKKSTVVLGGQFKPQKIVLLSKLVKFCKKIYIFGQLGVKILMASKNIQRLYNITNNKNQQQFIKLFLQPDEVSQKIILPVDLLKVQINGQNNSKQSFQVKQNIPSTQNIKIVDIGQKTCKLFESLEPGQFFIIGSPSIEHGQLFSIQKISKTLYTKKQQKKIRHQQEQSTPAGINYQKDLVVYIVGVGEEVFQKVELKQKKIKKKQVQQQQQEQQPEPEENQVKKVDQICDFRIINNDFFQSILAAQFSYGLKDICKYPKSD